jgi:hypothetical protein
MPSFEDLQTLWQQQPVRLATPAQAVALTGAFRRYGRRQNILYSLKLVVVAVQLAILVISLRHRPYMLLGACLADFSALLFLIRDWRAQHAVARLNFTDASTEFLHESLNRLQALRYPFRTREFYIALGGTFIGVNIMLAGNWLSHALTIPMPYVVYQLARFIRVRRFEHEAQPLIDRIGVLLRTLEGSPA